MTRVGRPSRIATRPHASSGASARACATIASYDARSSVSMARHATGAGARIVARVLATAFRDGLRAVRASGWRGPALALLSYVPVAATYAFGAALLVGLVLHVVVLLALVRVLG